ncbi:MAG: hypothetical protein P4L74_03060 [Candidatus Doudnabacteria bacterium]|nr:hypothetical protein [Candidatus Doudnabacteria bacterium]
MPVDKTVEEALTKYGFCVIETPTIAICGRMKVGEKMEVVIAGSEPTTVHTVKILSRQLRRDIFTKPPENGNDEIVQYVAVLSLDKPKPKR